MLSRKERPVPTSVICGHCETVHKLRLTHPVLISGVQSYLGHLITNRPGIRRAFLCNACYLNFHDASATIDGMVVKDDEEALEALAGIPDEPTTEVRG